MTQAPNVIPFAHLSLAFIPVVVVISILFFWSRKHNEALIALGRMLAQLLLIGYVLGGIFAANNVAIVVIVLAIMVMAASWISLRTAQQRNASLYSKALIALLISGISTLLLMVLGVLNLQPWYLPKICIPLAGMIFANSMNSISLSIDRLEAEITNGKNYIIARNSAFRAAMIPMTNALLAVGLVSIPGMMTGQILSGVSPLIAARYQIMVMCMTYGSAGIASALFLHLVRTDYSEKNIAEVTGQPITVTPTEQKTFDDH